MADFDVAAAGLSSPPPLAFLTSYRPSISVRNNGIHSALAFGSIRIYKAGSLVFSSDVFSGTIQPGATGLAQSVDYWTPTELGIYNVQGYVSCNLDQVERNNNLAPVSISVTAEPPPPPAPVALHASQHEEGGQDELTIDGLPGKAAERQDPYDHASNHESGGTDSLDVTDLPGVLLNPQAPTTHSNDAHDPAFTTAAETTAAIGNHNDDAAAHPDLVIDLTGHNADPDANTAAFDAHNDLLTAHPAFPAQQGPVTDTVTTAPGQTKTVFAWSIPGIESDPAAERLICPAALHFAGTAYVIFNNFATTLQLQLKASGHAVGKIIIPFSGIGANTYVVHWRGEVVPRITDLPNYDYLFARTALRVFTYKQATALTGALALTYMVATPEVQIADVANAMLITIEATLTSGDVDARLISGFTHGWRVMNGASATQ